VLMAVICLAVTLAAIAASFLFLLPSYRSA
jgi:hypothetical protein